MSVTGSLVTSAPDFAAFWDVVRMLIAKGEAVAERMRQESFEAEAVHLDVTDPVTRSSDRYFIFAGRLTACAQSPMDKGQISASSWE